MDMEKLAEYLDSYLNQDSSCKGPMPNPIVSKHCIRAMSLLGKECSEATKRWVLSLQTADRGFAETTGQHCWDYTTYNGSVMFSRLGLKPREGIYKWIAAHQNPDGGFSANFEPESNLRSTLFWSLALINLDKAELVRKNAASYLKQFHDTDADTLYKILRILAAVGEDISQYKETASGLPDNFHKLRIYDLLGMKPDFDIEIKPDSPYNAFAYLESCRILGKEPGDCSFIGNSDLEAGGFYNPKETSVLSAYEMVMCNKLLGRKNPDILDWILNQRQPDGSFNNDTKYTFWGNRAIMMLGGKTGELDRFLKSASVAVNTYSSFYVNYLCRVLGTGPFNQRATIAGLFRHKADGGFSPTVGGKPEMYDTYRAVSTIHNIQLMQKRLHINHLAKVRDDVIKWIYGCESENGGFGWVPGEQPYVQPTYQAMHTLHLLGAKPQYEHKRYLENCQNPDGGFHGGVAGTPSMLLYTYYCLAGLKILSGEISEEEMGL